MAQTKPIKITVTGRYRTLDQRVATIERIAGGRAYGRIPGDYDGTWWYTNGEHALCPVDDLYEKAQDE